MKKPTWLFTTPSLNPSYTGIWLRGDEQPQTKFILDPCLNPSYTGIWLRGGEPVMLWDKPEEVLTLLILEFGFGDVGLEVGDAFLIVLTLLILEFGFGADEKNGLRVIDEPMS